MTSDPAAVLQRLSEVASSLVSQVGLNGRVEHNGDPCAAKVRYIDATGAQRGHPHAVATTLVYIITSTEAADALVAELRAWLLRFVGTPGYCIECGEPISTVVPDMDVVQHGKRRFRHLACPSQDGWSDRSAVARVVDP